MSTLPYLASFPSPDRGVWYLGPIPIRAYALFIIVGIILAIWWGERRWRARGGDAGTITDVAVFAVPFGLVGGRLYHVITDYWRYFGPGKDPINALKIWDGGLGIWGAIALGAVGAWIACRRRKIPLPAVADAIVPGIVTAQAIGRLGNYFNQELYGGHTTLPWGMEVYRRFDPTTGLQDQLGGVATGHIPLPESPVQPTFLYELIWNLIVAAVLVWADRRFRLGRGRVLWLYVAGYTFGRFWIEMMRDDTATLVFGVRVNVWVAGLIFLAAVVISVLLRGRHREDPATLRSRGPGSEPGSGDLDQTDASEPKADDGAALDDPDSVPAKATADGGSGSHSGSGSGSDSAEHAAAGTGGEDGARAGERVTATGGDGAGRDHDGA